MAKIAIYAGTFDPITLGHIDIIHRASKMFDTLYVSIGNNPSKKPLFNLEKRKELIYSSIFELPNVVVSTFDGLLVNYAKQLGAKYLVRGLRSLTDFDYEMHLANINAKEAPEVDTVFIPTRLELSAISSSSVKELSKHGGNIKSYVNSIVFEEMSNIEWHNQ